jgi:hypothetical protein
MTIPHAEGAQPLSGEDKVVICFALLGLIGSVVLHRLNLPSVIISVFLSAGITALVYRFLGGIQGASFRVGALKLGGAIAALVGVAFWIDGRMDAHEKYLDAQRKESEAQQFHLVSDDVMVGTWEWDVIGASTSWNGHLDFVKSLDGLGFSGREYVWKKLPNNQDLHTLRLEMNNGVATITNRNSLTLESDVTDYAINQKYHWKSVAPFTLVPAFTGQLQPINPAYPNTEGKPWGMLITKVVK